jgi:general stress protein 26
MLTTVDSEGHLHSRPMAVQEMAFDGDLWFFTGKGTKQAQ